MVGPTCDKCKTGFFNLTAENAAGCQGIICSLYDVMIISGIAFQPTALFSSLFKSSKKSLIFYLSFFSNWIMSIFHFHQAIVIYHLFMHFTLSYY